MGIFQSLNGAVDAAKGAMNAAKGAAGPAKGDEKPVGPAPEAPSTNADGEEPEAAGIKSMLKRSVDGFTWIYVFVLMIAAGAMVYMSFNAYADVRALDKYNPAPVEDNKTLLYKDTIERAILNYDPMFSAFTEGKGALSTGLSAGVNFMIVLIIHIVVAIIFAFNKETKGFSDVAEAFYRDGKVTGFTYGLGIALIYYVLLIIYKFVFFDGILKNRLVHGLLDERRQQIKDFNDYIATDILYGGGDSRTFYGMLGGAESNNGAILKEYVTRKASGGPGAVDDVAKMIATFNLYIYYYSFYAGSTNFWGTDIAKRFNPSTMRDDSIFFSDSMPVLTIKVGGGDVITNVLNDTQGISIPWSDEIPNGDEIRAKVDEKMTALNLKARLCFSDMNWTRRNGIQPSNIVRSFKEYLDKRFMYLFFVSLPFYFLIIYGMLRGYRLIRETAVAKIDAIQKQEKMDKDLANKLIEKGEMPQVEKKGFFSKMADKVKGMMPKKKEAEAAEATEAK